MRILSGIASALAPVGVANVAAAVDLPTAASNIAAVIDTACTGGTATDTTTPTPITWVIV